MRQVIFRNAKLQKIFSPVSAISDTFSLLYSSEFELKLKKICKGDKGFCHQIEKKILSIQENPESGKPLKNILKGTRRIHAGHYVIIYEIDHKNRNIILINIDHHDRVYIQK